MNPQEIEGLETIPEDKTPLWEHWEAFVRFEERYGRSIQTVKSVRNELRSIVRNMGIYTIEDLNSRTFRTALEQYEDATGILGGTINTYRKNANTYVRWLVQEELLDKNYISTKMPKVTVKQKEQPTFTQEEIDILRKGLMHRECKSPFLRKRGQLIFELQCLTGLRNCELLELETDSIYQDPKTKKWMLVIDGKKQKGRKRYYVLNTGIRDLYLEYKSLCPESSTNALWLTERGTALTNNGLNMYYKRLSAEAGFKVSGHRFRRYVATELNKHDDIDLEGIAEHLGHTRTSTTKRYIAPSGDLTRKTTARMMALQR